MLLLISLGTRRLYAAFLQQAATHACRDPRKYIFSFIASYHPKFPCSPAKPKQNSSMSSESSQTDIAIDGDVILVVGPLQKRLRV